MVAEDTKPIEEEPQMFNKALNHPDPKSRGKWQEAIQKEFNNRYRGRCSRVLHLPIVGAFKKSGYLKLSAMPCTRQD